MLYINKKEERRKSVELKLGYGAAGIGAPTACALSTHYVAVRITQLLVREHVTRQVCRHPPSSQRNPGMLE